jgi:hypothetical protein
MVALQQGAALLTALVRMNFTKEEGEWWKADESL